MIKVRAHGLKIFHLGMDAKVPTGTPWVGRPSMFANPWSHEKGKSLHKTKTAREAAEKYREYLMGHKGLVKEAQKKLRGVDLECGCSGTKEEDCYATVIMEIANAPEEPKSSVPVFKDEKVTEKPKKEKKVKYVPTFKEF